MHTSTTAPELVNDLRQRAQFGIGAALSMGLDGTDAPFAQRSQATPGLARLFIAGRGITAPEKGRTEVPYWITAPEEGSTKRTSTSFAAHIFSLEDAKGLLRAGVDAFAHGIRDRDIDDEVIALFKARPNFVLIPNMPDRGVAVDYSWLRGRIPDGELQKLQAAATNRPAVQETFGIQARNLAKLAAAGVKIAVGTDGNTPWAPHVEMADMVASGMTPAQVIVAGTRNAAEFVRTSSCSTPTRWTTSRTPVASRRSTSAASPSRASAPDQTATVPRRRGPEKPGPSSESAPRAPTACASSRTTRAAW